MTAPHIDFWFTMGSSVFLSERVAARDMERSTGITFRWRPFHLLIILQEMKHIPFADKPTKSAYMWRDMADVLPCRHSGKTSSAVSGQQSVVANWLPQWVCARAEVQISCGPLIGDRFSLGRKQEASQTCRKA